MSTHITLRVIRSRRAKFFIKKKTRKAYAKRFRETGTGMILSTQSGRRHNLSNRTKRSLLGGKGYNVANPSLCKMIRYHLGLKTIKINKKSNYTSQVKSVNVSKLVKKVCNII